MTLLERIESAGAEEQRGLLGAAFNALNKAPHTNFADLNAHAAKAMRFKALLEAEAYVDAALMLVPEGWFWSVTMRGEKRGGFHACCVREGPLVWYEASTPALAIAAASLRAGGHDAD